MRTISPDHPEGKQFGSWFNTATKIIKKYPDKFEGVCASDDDAMFKVFKGFKVKNYNATLTLALSAEQEAAKKAKLEAEKAQRAEINRRETEARNKRAQQQLLAFKAHEASSSSSSSRPKRKAAEKAEGKLKEPNSQSSFLASDSEDETEQSAKRAKFYQERSARKKAKVSELTQLKVKKYVSFECDVRALTFTATFAETYRAVGADSYRE